MIWNQAKLKSSNLADSYWRHYPQDEKYWKLAFNLSIAVSPKLYPRLFFFALYAVVVTLICLHFSHLTLSPLIAQIAGGFILLLLVFRLNAGHDRWWEGRKIWGTIVNSTRILALQSKTYHPENYQIIKPLIQKIPFAIKDVLRKKDDASLQDFLSLTQKLMQQLPSAQTHMALFLSMEREIKRLVDCCGMCERILKTPLPLICDIKVKRFLLIYLAMLPFALVDIFYWATPLLQLLVAYPMFALEQIGVELENPFSQKRLNHLPLTSLSNSIKSTIETIN